MLLKAPGAIGAMRLKNRVIMAPMGTNFGTAEGFATERDVRYYAERARGGVAMIVTEAMNVSAGARNHLNSLCVFDDAFIPGLSAVVRGIQAHGAFAVGQLNHRGQLLRRSVLGMEPVGPSAGVNPATGEPVRALGRDEIPAIARDFLASARRLGKAGYDAVEIHAANGYLFHQFFSPRFNRRYDEYGGSIENRMRFLLETVGLLRAELPALPVLVRVSATEFVDGGYSQDDAIALVRALERAGVVAIDLSGGSNETPALSRYCIQPPSFPRRCLEPFARPFTDAVRIPVILAGRIISPEDAEGVLAAGSADFISLGRALLADPHWCLKAFGEVDAPIRPCIACNVCLERLTLEQEVSCVQNPLMGTRFEALEWLEPQHRCQSPSPGPTAMPDHADAFPRRRVLVIGAGVSGAEAARTAAGLGHDVEIWEQADKAGGQMPLALAAPDKAEVAGVWTYRTEALERLGVPIRLSTAVTAAAIRRHAPDVVFIATGARPRDVPGLLDVGVPILQAWEVLAAPERFVPATPEHLGPTSSEQLGQLDSVTIIGGGIVGLETADLLAARGCRVTIIEMGASVATAMARNNRFEVLARLTAAGARVLTHAAVASVRDGRLVIRRTREPRASQAGAGLSISTGAPSRGGPAFLNVDRPGEDEELRGQDLEIDPGDAIVLAVGPEPNRDVVPEVEAAGVPYVLVGDCNRPGDFLTAIADASLAALALSTTVSTTPSPTPSAPLSTTLSTMPSETPSTTLSTAVPTHTAVDLPV